MAQAMEGVEHSSMRMVTRGIAFVLAVAMFAMTLLWIGALAPDPMRLNAVKDAAAQRPEDPGVLTAG